MSLLTTGTRPAAAPSVTAAELRDRTDALSAALAAGDGQLTPATAARAGAVVAKARERTALAEGHTVVALAGATGSGKSSLFNSLVGAPVAEIGARRPTSSKPTAAVWGNDPADALLDWLGVKARHRVEVPEGGPVGLGALPRLDGLVLLDLPDFDSRDTSHRRRADRVLEKVDVFVWVTDPQKYADARLHEDYLTVLAGHDSVTLVVLNQADRLTPEALAACRSDLTRLVAEDGVQGNEVIATSALTGAGVVDLQHRVGGIVVAQRAARERLAGDLTLAARDLRGDVGHTESAVQAGEDSALVEALVRAAGIPTVLEAVERDYRQEARASTGWPFSRWARALRPDPLRRLRTAKDDATDTVGGITPADVRAVLGRSSLPPATPAARAAVALATRELGQQEGQGLPARWADAVADAATPAGPELGDALDTAVLRTPLRDSKPVWWSVFGLLQLVFAALVVAGLGWLVALVAMALLRPAAPSSSGFGMLPWALLMFLGGLLLGVGLAALARPFARVGARRRREVIALRLREAVAAVAQEHIVAPVRRVLDRHRATREALDRAAGHA